MNWDRDEDLGKMHIAVELARVALKSKPQNYPCRLLLAHALIATGQWEDAIVCLRDALAVAPASAEPEISLARTLLSLDRFEEALPHARTALAISPSDPLVRNIYCSILASLGSWDELRREAESAPALYGSHPLLMERHLHSMPPAERLQFCELHLAANPGHTNARYLKAVTLAILGRNEEATCFMGMERLVSTSTLEPPANFADRQSFHDSLLREIRANPTLCRDPRSKAVRGAFRTRFLRQPGSVAIDALLGRIREAVEAWERQLETGGDEFLEGRPKKAQLRAWAVIQDADGRQKPHRHPDGWISGVYYVAAPRDAADGSFRGPLILGALDSTYGVEPPWGIRLVDPEPGRLVLFPSWLPHATEPGGVDGARVCVAFDVVPAPVSRG